MSETIHNFQKSLKIGQDCEKLFLGTYSGLEQLSGRLADFNIIKTNTGLELKVEQRTIESTPNIFVEVFSRPGVPGGPAQALKHSELYCHWFIKSKQLFAYKTKELMDFVQSYIIGKLLIPIKNTQYITYGIPIPRNLISHLEIDISEYGICLK